MTTSTPPSLWTGRNDGDDPRFRRWHTAVSDSAAGAGAGALTTGTALVGFASDEGVKRNGGRPGAVEGPAAIRKALAALAIAPAEVVADLGDVWVSHSDLEGAQSALGDLLAAALRSGQTPIVLGGGHETAYGSYLGLARSGVLEECRLGILNLDAHFDLRRESRATSGTPFLQIAEDEAARGAEFTYGVVGISEANNTGALFDTAESLKVSHLFDVDCQASDRKDVLQFVADFVQHVDLVYLTLDLDVLPASVAPGVSAPAAVGVPAALVLDVCRQVAGSGKLRLFDVVELNPVFDRDGQTASVAARMVHAVSAALQPNPPRSQQ